MRIGILSDSHGNTKRLAAAIEALRGRDVEAIVHCGDIGSASCIDLLAEAGVPAYAIAGNVDRDHQRELTEAAEAGGVHFAESGMEVPTGDGRSLVATHGHDEKTLRDYIEGQRFAFVCHGHTHKTRDERRDTAHIINPGALHNPKGPNYPTCAFLDTAADQVEFIPVET